MALNPEISLGVRPPVLQPLQIQSPLERYGKVLTLRGMMEQQQLRGLQMQGAQEELAQARQEAEGVGEFRRRQLAGENLTPNQSLGILGPKAGGAYLKGQAELAAEQAKRQRTEEERAENHMRLIGQSALNSKNQQDRDFRITALVKGGVIPPAFADQILAQPFDLEQTRAYGEMMLSAADQKRDAREAAARAHQEKLEPFQVRSAAAAAATAEQTAAGTRPIQPAEQARLDSEKTRLDREAAAARETARHNRAMETRVGMADRLGLAREQRMAVNQIAGQFDNEPMVKNYNVIAEGNNFVRSLGEKGGANPSDDQALIYAYAKAMDPGSVVREGEYATVQKYSQSWAEQFGFKAARIFSNSPFLTDESRKLLKSTIEKKAASAKASYDNVYSEYGRRIEKNAGVQNGKDFLTNYGQAFDGGGAPGAGATRINTKAEYDKLPSGSQYVDAQDGKTYTKR